MASLCNKDSAPPPLRSRDHHQVQRLRRYLQSSDPQRVYKVLVEIRVNYATGNREKAKMMLESDLIKNLISVLKENDAKLINITLSILGNLLIHREARSQFKLYDGMKVITPIFKNIANESILGRAARVVGNAWTDGLGFSPPEDAFFRAFANVLPNLTQPPTIASFFRVLRVACQRSAKVESSIMKTWSIVEDLVEFLSSSSDEVVIAVLKLLSILTNQEADQLCIYLECKIGFFLDLCNHQSVSIRESAFEALLNLSDKPDLRVLLGAEGALLIIINKLTSSEFQLKEPMYESCIHALCSYTEEAVNRVRLRELGGLGILVDVLNRSNESTKKSLKRVIGSLQNFSYDTESLKVLQANGLTHALIGLIERYVSIYKVRHFCEYESSKPGDLHSDEIGGKVIPCKACRKILRNKKAEGSQGNASPKSSTPEPNPESEQDSMEEEYSEVEFGPPLELGEESDDEEIADTSSSNVEPTTRIGENLLEGSEEQGAHDDQDKHFRISSPSYQQVIYEQEVFERLRAIEGWVPWEEMGDAKMNYRKDFMSGNWPECSAIKQKRLDYERTRINVIFPPCLREREKAEDYLFIEGIFPILHHIQASNMESSEAYSFRSTKALVSYIKDTRHPSKAAKSYLVQVAKSMYFLIPSIRNYQFSWIINALSSRSPTSSDKCDRCRFNESLRYELFREYSKTAESGFGIGILNNSLVSGNETEMHSAAVATPLIVRSRPALRNSLLLHNGLRVLMDILKNPADEDIFANAVLGIQELAKTLNFHSLASSLPRLGSDWRQKKECKYATSEVKNDAVLVMDDGSKVSCNKETLCAATSYFSAMFGGDFKESILTEVPMRYRSTPAMNGLVHLVYGCQSCSTLIKLGAVELVELLHMTDEFLLEDSEKLVAAMILRKCNIPSSAIILYSTIKKEKTRLLGVDDGLNRGFFNHILGAIIRLESRVKVFKAIARSSYGKSFIEDLESFIKGKLANPVTGSRPQKCPLHFQS